MSVPAKNKRWLTLYLQYFQKKERKRSNLSLFTNIYKNAFKSWRLFKCSNFLVLIHYVEFVWSMKVVSAVRLSTFTESCTVVSAVLCWVRLMADSTSSSLALLHIKSPICSSGWCQCGTSGCTQRHLSQRTCVCLGLVYVVELLALLSSYLFQWSGENETVVVAHSVTT